MPNQNAQNLGGASWRSHHGANETPPVQSPASGLIVVPEKGNPAAGVPAAATAEDRDPTGEAIAVSPPLDTAFGAPGLPLRAAAKRMRLVASLTRPPKNCQRPMGPIAKWDGDQPPGIFLRSFRAAHGRSNHHRQGSGPWGRSSTFSPAISVSPVPPHGACQDSPARWPSCPGRGGRLRSPPQSRKRPTRAS